MVITGEFIDFKAEYYKKEALLAQIKEKINFGLPEEDCFIEGYVYIITIDSFDITNFSVRDARKILPTKVRAYLGKEKSQYIKEDNLYFIPLKNGKPLKKQIEDSVSYKPKLKFFFTEEEMMVEYEKDLKIIDKIIEKKYSSIFALKKELQDALI